MLGSSRAWPVLGASVVLALLAGCGESITAPTAYKQWNAKDGTFAMEYPEGWNADGGGKSGLQWAEFKKGSCVVTVDTNTSGSLVGDIAGSATAGFGTDGEQVDPKVAEELAPVAASHKFLKDTFAGAKIEEQFSNYKEEEPVAFKSSLGDGRKSAFTASKGMGQKVKGYRATVLSNDKSIIVFASCPQQHWAKLQPAYDKMLDSLALGTPEN
jgi:hypothetical protein